MTSFDPRDLLRSRVFRLAAAGVLVAVAPLSEMADAAPHHAVQAQSCVRGGPVIELCCSTDRDGYVGARIACDEQAA